MMAENEEVKTNALEALRIMSDLMQRNRYAQFLGMSFGEKRDLYTALGYSKELLYSDYWNVFKRGRLGKRIVCAPVDSTWRGEVGVYEEEEPKDTKFEKAWKELNAKHKIFAKFARLDKLVGLGEYAVLLLGFSDGKALEEPLEGTNLQLIYVQPYAYNNITIVEWEGDEKHPRYGLPRMYTLQIQTIGAMSNIAPTAGGTLGKTTRVHYSRLIHVAEGLLDNDVIGTPRLESCFNSVQDLEKIAGGSAEMYWQGALGGKAFSSKDGATIDAQSKVDMQEQIDEYVHGMRRYLRLQNMDVQDLSPQTSDPTNAIAAQLDLISGDTGIPKRILIGSERGELASTQDESNWLNRIGERRTQYAEPYIIRPVIDVLIKVGALPETQSGEYHISWPDLWASSDDEQAKVAKTRTEALAAYVNAPGADQFVPVDFFLEEFLNLSKDQVERIKEMLGVGIEEIIVPEPPEPATPAIQIPTKVVPGNE
jgi:uncharacterized protein